MLIKGSNFVNAPAGQHNAVCVDVVDLGVVETEWKGKKRMRPLCRVVFEIDEPMESGRRFSVQRTFTASLNEKADLRHFLESWRGKPFTAEELKGFETDVLIGVGAYIQIQHKVVGDNTYANITSIMLPPKGMKWLEPQVGDDGQQLYVRVKDREPVPATPEAPPDETGGFPDDDLPF